MEKKKAPIIGLLLVIFLSLRQFSSTFVKKIKFQIVYQSYCKDHLHIRGENKTIYQSQSSTVGSPPHTWRKQDYLPKPIIDSRITSTYVEKTNRYDVRFCLKRDHLHIRGENLRYANRFFAGLGSPPHTWRKRSFRLGITSTYVEKTLFGVLSKLYVQDHLHIRGENLKSITSKILI